MSPDTWGFIGVLIGAFIGASASIITTIISNRNAIKIQSKLEKNKRELLFREFQRETLLKIQEKISEGLRVVGKVHIEDVDNFRKTNKWGQGLLDTDLDNKIANIYRELLYLKERIQKEGLRNEIKEVVGLMNSVLYSRSKIESEQGIINLIEKQETLSENVGKELREYF